MPFWTVILKNDSGSTVILEDFGVEIANTNQYTISDYFDYSDIADSKELDTLIGAGTLVINNGITDFTSVDGVNYIKRDNIHNDLETHYTKTELNTSGGGSVVHWDNIINAPSFGSPTWIEPVLYRVLDISSAAPATPLMGDVYVDTDDQHYYKWDGSVWQDDGSASTDDRVVDLSNGTQNVAVFDGTTTWADQGQSDDNSAVMVNDDGDGKNAQYVYSTETNVWIKIADVDFEDHLNGGPNKHDASEIDVEGQTYINLPSAPSDLETVIGDIDTQLTEALDNNTLDGAYNEGGAGAGRFIGADSGPVEIDTETSTTAPLRLVPKAALPSTALLDGQLAITDGLLFIYDSTRGKWLSVQRQFLVFGRKGRTKNQYINFAAGTLASNNSGYRLQRNATIVSLSGQLDASETCDIHLRRNDTGTNIVTLSISSATGNSDISVNTDINVGDFLQSYCSVAVGNVHDPMFIVEIAYRA